MALEHDGFDERANHRRTESSSTVIRAADQVVEVGPGAGDDGGSIVFDGIVQPGEEIEISGLNSGGTFGPNLQILVNNEANGFIRTNCVGIVGPGFETGNFLITMGRSLDGGPLCPVAPV